MGRTSIVNETPQQGKGLSLKWKWALGSAAGVFLIFILFAWFVAQAFSNQMIVSERKSVMQSLTAVETRLDTLTAQTLLPEKVDSQLQPKGNDFNQIVKDPVLQELSRSGYTVHVYNKKGVQIYPLTDQDESPTFKTVKTMKVTVERIKSSGTKVMVGRTRLINDNNTFIGYIVIKNNLTSYHRMFQRAYLIIVVLFMLG